MMKKELISMAVPVLALLMFTACATPEERAARAAEQKRKVEVALAQRNYKIGVDRMYPMKGPSRNVSYGYGVEVRNDSLISYLPYIGGVYRVPYGGGMGLNFKERIGSYRETQVKNKRRIEIEVKNIEDTYLYSLEIFDNGSSSIDVQALQRDRISFNGKMTFDIDK